MRSADCDLHDLCSGIPKRNETSGAAFGSWLHLPLSWVSQSAHFLAYIVTASGSASEGGGLETQSQVRKVHVYFSTNLRKLERRRFLRRHLVQPPHLQWRNWAQENEWAVLIQGPRYQSQGQMIVDVTINNSYNLSTCYIREYLINLISLNPHTFLRQIL